MTTSPDLSLPAPKNLRENIEYRRAILARAAGDTEFQEACWIRSARDIIWYIDTFCWTSNQKDYPTNPNRLFVTYPDQERAIRKISDGLGKRDFLIEKSRTAGASWCNLAVIEHAWHFRSDQFFLLGSRTAEYVDQPGNTKSLFWKLDYLIEKLPSWMIPKYERTKMHLVNLENGSAIDGETTTADFGTGDRRTAILLDEFAKVRQFGSLIAATTQHVTKCRIFNSTPEGQAGGYYEEWVRMKREFPDQVIRLHWTGQPDYAAGLYKSINGQLVIIDKSYKFPDNYPFVLDDKIRSPWYDDECRRSPSKLLIARDLDIDFIGSGGTGMDWAVNERLRQQYARTPTTKGTISYDENGNSPRWVESRMHGKLLLWFSPEMENQKPPKGEYVIGCDIATGKGGIESTNSVLSVARRDTGEKVARFAVNDMEPHEFAIYAIGLCNWFYGAFLIWEDNGPGGLFGQHVQKRGYTNIFYRDKDEKSADHEKAGKAGWRSDETTKQLLLWNYFYAVTDGKFLNPDEEGLREILEYVFDENGNLVHSKAEQSNNPLSSGPNHGDIVIADALAYRGVTDTPLETKKVEKETPPGSFLHRREQYQAKQRRANKY